MPYTPKEPSPKARDVAAHEVGHNPRRALSEGCDRRDAVKCILESVGDAGPCCLFSE